MYINIKLYVLYIMDNTEIDMPVYIFLTHVSKSNPINKHIGTHGLFPLFGI